MDDVLVPLGREQSNFRPPTLDQCVGANRSAVGEQADLRSKFLKWQTQIFTGDGHGVEHALGKIGRC